LIVSDDLNGSLYELLACIIQTPAHKVLMEPTVGTAA